VSNYKGAKENEKVDSERFLTVYRVVLYSRRRCHRRLRWFPHR